MPIRRFSGSNIVERASGQEGPVPATTPPPPDRPSPTPGGSFFNRLFSPSFGDNAFFDLGGEETPPPSFWDPNSGVDPTEGQLLNVPNELTGEVETFRYQVPTIGTSGIPLEGADPTWIPFSSGRPLSATGAGSDPAFLAETIRSNMAREAEARRRRALDAASNAASAFLTGTQLSDARRLNAFEESRALLPFLVDPEQEFFAGQGPGGLVQSALESIGVQGFQPSRIQHKQLTPAQLAIPPTGEQVGSEIVESIGDIRGAGVP